MEKLIITYRNAFFGDGQRGFDYEEFVELLEFLIYNIYIRFGDYVFKQIVGIPMESNYAPLLAKLYLIYHEFHFLQNYHHQ